MFGWLMARTTISINITIANIIMDEFHPLFIHHTFAVLLIVEL
jgi:hypothetical protein